MISEYTKSNTSKILLIINDASLRYKGIIPDNCWHVPYMLEQELIDEFSDGVRMFGYHHNKKYLNVNWYRHHLTELKTIKKKDTTIKFL